MVTGMYDTNTDDAAAASDAINNGKPKIKE
jgi:hypothetical protein